MKEKQIYDSAVHLCKNGSRIQALIHILGCYGCKEEWLEIRRLLMKDHPMNFRYTDTFFWTVKNAYDRGCNKILKRFGASAWYHTLSY